HTLLQVFLKSLHFVSNLLGHTAFTIIAPCANLSGKTLLSHHPKRPRPLSALKKVRQTVNRQSLFVGFPAMQGFLNKLPKLKEVMLQYLVKVGNVAIHIIYHLKATLR